MRQSRLPQPDLFKTTLHELIPSQRVTAAVALLKALLVEAISQQTSAATDAIMSTPARDGGVEIEECANNDQNKP
jgi:hypothetical protein